MKNQSSIEKFNLQQYQAIVAEIDTCTLNYLMEQIEKHIPESHATVDTLYYAVLRVVTRAICMICGDNPAAKERAVADFCSKLPKLVHEAKLVVVQTGSDTG